jgi:hypothetical protein
VRVLFTLRSDYLDHFATADRGPLGTSLLRATFMLPAMGADALRLAIVGPARVRGFAMESEAMVAELVAEGQIHADALRSQDANFSETYGVDATTMGPDEVGSFPADQSPFGVFDLIGNVREWVEQREGRSARGGDSTTEPFLARAACRYTDAIDYTGVGLRVCAPAPTP